MICLSFFNTQPMNMNIFLVIIICFLGLSQSLNVVDVLLARNIVNLSLISDQISVI